MKKLLFLFLITCLGIAFTPKKITWVAIGDSITYLNEHRNETGNRITKGYMTRVVEKLPNITYDGLHPSDKGYDIIAILLVKEMKKIVK